MSDLSKRIKCEPRVGFLSDWTVGQILRANPHIKFRKQFLDNPYLDQITLGEVTNSAFSMDAFLENCRQLPDCGETSLRRLCEVIRMAVDGKIFLP
jgi:hypothetical protein